MIIEIKIRIKNVKEEDQWRKGKGDHRRKEEKMNREKRKENKRRGTHKNLRKISDEEKKT